MSKSICLTGSRVYGEPQPDSDYDVVLLVNFEQLQFLADAAGVDLTKAETRDEDGHIVYGQTEDSATLKFGNLNIVALTNPAEFEGWVNGTKQCLDLLDKKAKENLTLFPFGAPHLRVSRIEAKKIMCEAVDAAIAAAAPQLPDYKI